MLDFHNHIIPGIDDGATDAEVSIQLIEGLNRLGFTKFIHTPHVIADTHPNTPQSIENGFNLLKSELSSKNISCHSNFAAEYMLDDIFHQKLKNKEQLLTLSGDKLLVEFSYIHKPDHVERFSFDLQIAGYEPVLAHPERYIYYHQNYGYNYEHLKDLGFELQLNLLSLTPYYGKEVQKIATKLLNEGYYDFACTDIHHTKHLDALESFFAKDSLESLFKKYNLRNSELE